MPPDAFRHRLKRLCEENGIMFIDDEVQTGFAKTGKIWGIEHCSLSPDVMCISKAMANGLPVGACISKDEVMDWSDGAHENTLGGSPIVMAAALAVLKIIAKESLAENAKNVRTYAIRRLKEVQETYGAIGDVRG